jgi:hypothetical protein
MNDSQKKVGLDPSKLWQIGTPAQQKACPQESFSIRGLQANHKR